MSHQCVNGRRCTDKADGQPHPTEQPHALCPSCLKRSAKHIADLPKQWTDLHTMIGDRHAGIDVNIRRPKPGGTVLLNIHVDTLLGAILEATTGAAEVLADAMNMNDPTAPKEPAEPIKAPPWADAPKLDDIKQLRKASRIIVPNLNKLSAITGVGGRDETDPAIDVMFWVRSGYAFGVKCTTGVQMIQRLDHLSSLAYFTLGQTRARTRRDMPCTRCRAKTVGRWAGSDYFNCETCGAEFEEDDIRRQDKILIELHKRGILKPQETM